MKSKINLTPILFILSLLPFLQGCSQEDDIAVIFTGKTWKMSYIHPEGNYNAPLDVWEGNEEAFQKSMDLLAAGDNFTLEFYGGSLGNGQFGGTFKGRGVTSTVQGNWVADGKDRRLQFSNVQWAGEEKDIYALTFRRALNAEVNAYSGDSYNLFIHYKEGQLLRVIAMLLMK